MPSPVRNLQMSVEDSHGKLKATPPRLKVEKIND